MDRQAGWLAAASGTDRTDRPDRGTLLHLELGTAAYRRTCRALFVAGFCAFSVLYVAQGTLPAVGAEFHVSPTEASLTVSLTTLPLALGVVLAASISERRGRLGLLVGSLLAAALCTVAAAASPTFIVLLALRVLTGLSLAALPAVAMAYVAEEVSVRSLGSAMGLYIGATGFGGMTGRLLGGLLAGLSTWRVSLAVVGLIALCGGLYVASQLPASAHFEPQPEGLLRQLAAARVHLGDAVLLRLFGCGFALMGSMVAFFNYLLYRLEARPFGLSQQAAATVFVLYAAGTLSANWLGRLTDRRPRRSVLLLGMGIMTVGLAVSLANVLALVLIGTALTTFGFFGAHAVASGWVNARARSRRAQASSLYLLFYHLGSSLLGVLGGLAFGAGGWNGLVLLLALPMVFAVGAALSLPRVVVPRFGAIESGSEP